MIDSMILRCGVAHRAMAQCTIGLGLSLSLGSWRSSSTPTPPVPQPPVLLTAPTITLSGYTATITLGTFSGATSQTDYLYEDGVSVATASAGTLDVTAYAGHDLTVVSTGTNAAGSTVSTSYAVSVPAAAVTATKYKIVFKRNSYATDTVGFITASEIQFCDASATMQAGTYTTTTTTPHNLPAMNDGVLNVQADGNYLSTTAFATPTRADTLLFTAGTAFTLAKLRIAPSGTQYAPGAFEVWYSNDGTNWTLLTTYTYPAEGTINAWGYASNTLKDFPIVQAPPAAIAATTMGVNYNSVVGYGMADVAKNLAETPGSVRGTNSEYYSSQISSVLGYEAGVLPMDTNGVITDYPTVGGVKRTSIRFTLGTVRTGTFNVTPPAGMTASVSTITGPTSPGSESVVVDLSGPIPAGGIIVAPPASANFTVLLSGDASPSESITGNAMHDGYDMGTHVRWMSTQGVNNQIGRTLTAGDELYDGPSTQGPNSLRRICDYHNLIYTKFAKIVSPWVCVHPNSDTSYMSAMATYLKTNLNAAIPVEVELGNEIWNWLTYETKWIALQGYNAGYSATNPTPAKPAEFFNAQSGNARYPAITYATNDRVLLWTSGLDNFGVWKALQAVPTGATGAIPTTSAGNAYWSYETNDGDATGLAFAVRQFKADKETQMITAFEAVFTGGDRARLVLHHADMTGIANTLIAANLAMNSNLTHWNRRSTGCYWGHGFGPIDLYKYEAANTGQALTPAVKALYTAFAGGSPTDQETFLAAWFSTAHAAADAAINYHVGIRNGVDRLLTESPYNLAMGAIPHGVYEGNLEMQFGGFTNTAAANAMRTALLTDARMSTLIEYFMGQWQTKVGGLFCWFALNNGRDSQGAASQYWSIREVSGVDTKISAGLMAVQAGL